MFVIWLVCFLICPMVICISRCLHDFYWNDKIEFKLFWLDFVLATGGLVTLFTCLMIILVVGLSILSQNGDKFGLFKRIF
jgi:hypothetical protein